MKVVHAATFFASLGVLGLMGLSEMPFAKADANCSIDFPSMSEGDYLYPKDAKDLRDFQKQELCRIYPLALARANALLKNGDLKVDEKTQTVLNTGRQEERHTTYTLVTQGMESKDGSFPAITKLSRSMERISIADVAGTTSLDRQGVHSKLQITATINTTYDPTQVGTVSLPSANTDALGRPVQVNKDAERAVLSIDQTSSVEISITLKNSKTGGSIINIKSDRLSSETVKNPNLTPEEKAARNKLFYENTSGLAGDSRTVTYEIVPNVPN